MSDLPHPHRVLPGSARDKIENPDPVDTAQFPYVFTDEEHAAIAAELEERSKLTGTG